MYYNFSLLYMSYNDDEEKEFNEEDIDLDNVPDFPPEDDEDLLDTEAEEEEAYEDDGLAGSEDSEY